MATFFVRKTGSDAAAGTSAGAAWKTIGKALGASGIASGDTVWIGAGCYREAVSVAMTSATVETFITGDVDGSHTGDPGEVILSAWTTSDTAAGSTSACVTLSGRDFLTFQKITFIPYSSGGSVDATLATSINITFRDCAFLSASGGGATYQLTFTNATNVVLHLLVERCVFQCVSGGIKMTAVTSTTADYDLDVVIRTCRITMLSTASAILLTTTGAGAFKPGGPLIENCTLWVSNGVTASTANVSTTIPVKVRYCWIVANSTALSAATSGNIDEDYNVINASIPRTLVTAGTHSLSGDPALLAPRLSIGQEVFVGTALRPFLAPLDGSPLLGWVPTGLTPAVPTVDLLNRPRPAGGRSGKFAVGAFERGSTAIQPVSGVPLVPQWTAATAHAVAYNGYIASPLEAGNPLRGQSSFTCAGWAYLDSKAANRGIIGKTGGGTGWSLFYRNSGDGFALEIVNGSTVRAQDTVTTPATSTWYYVLGWLDISLQTVNVQVNNGTVVSTACTILPVDDAFWVGLGQIANLSMDGRLQGLGFWSRVLTSGERTSLYNSGNGVLHDGLTGTLLNNLVSFWDLDELIGSGMYRDSAGTYDAVALTNQGRIAPTASAAGKVAYSTPLSDAGTYSLKLSGPSYHDFQLPVDAASTTVGVKFRTAGYSGTDYPRIEVLNGAGCGVADASADASGVSDSSFTTLSLAAFTPTSKGIVTIRLRSRTSNSAGIAYFDTLTVT